MHLQTLNLLALLGDETTSAVLDELRKGPQTEDQLKSLATVDRKVLSGRLRELRKLEVVSFEKSPPTAGKRGPRPRLYRVTKPELFGFCDTADEFALALIEATGASLREHIEKSANPKR